jgi:hypothetical protein
MKRVIKTIRTLTLEFTHFGDEKMYPYTLGGHRLFSLILLKLSSYQGGL